MNPQLSAYTGPERVSLEMLKKLTGIASHFGVGVGLFDQGSHNLPDGQHIEVPQNTTLVLIKTERPIPKRLTTKFKSLFHK